MQTDGEWRKWVTRDPNAENTTGDVGFQVVGNPTNAQLKTMRSFDNIDEPITWEIRGQGNKWSDVVFGGDVGDGFKSLAKSLRNTGQIHEAITTEACGNCRFYVDGGACALVKGSIDPIKGLCKFYEAGTTLPFTTQVWPVYEQAEAEYFVRSYEPYLRETTIIDRKQQLEADGTPENEMDDILRQEYGDISIVETWGFCLVL